MPRKITTTAQAFRSHRLEAGLSILELSNASGVDRRTLYRIEADDVVPRMRTVRAVAKALNLKPVELLPEAVAA